MHLFCKCCKKEDKETPAQAKPVNRKGPRISLRHSDGPIQPCFIVFFFLGGGATSRFWPGP